MALAWKALAKFRGWPASEHEKNRRGRRLAEARIDAALALHKGYAPHGCSGCHRMVKALRGER